MLKALEPWEFREPHSHPTHHAGLRGLGRDHPLYHHQLGSLTLDGRTWCPQWFLARDRSGLFHENLDCIDDSPPEGPAAWSSQLRHTRHSRGPLTISPDRFLPGLRKWSRRSEASAGQPTFIQITTSRIKLRPEPQVLPHFLKSLISSERCRLTTTLTD